MTRRPSSMRLVMATKSDRDDYMLREVTLGEDGGLTIAGHDMGRGVEGAFGSFEYEFSRRLSATEVDTLRKVLGIPAHGDLLQAIDDGFGSTDELEDFVGQMGIPGTFWSRIGD